MSPSDLLTDTARGRPLNRPISHPYQSWPHTGLGSGWEHPAYHSVRRLHRRLPSPLPAGSPPLIAKPHVGLTSHISQTSFKPRDSTPLHSDPRQEIDSQLEASSPTNDSKTQSPGGGGELDFVKCDNIFKELQRLQGLSNETTSLASLTTFEGVNAHEYAYTEQKLEDEFEWITMPAYFRDSQKLVVTMPSEVHEAPLQHMGFRLQAAVTSMPLQYGEYKIAIREHRNTTVRGSKSDSIPDIHLSISATGGQASHLKLRRRLLFVECTFSETEAHAKEKLKYLIEDHPGALAAMMINITEIHHPLPPPTSPTAIEHASKLAPGKELLPRPIDPNNPLSALYEGIRLLDVQSVTIMLWLRDSIANKPIDLDDRDSSVYAEGTIYPQQSTVAVDRLLEKMMLEVKALALTYAQQIAPHPPQSTSPLNSLTQSSVSVEGQGAHNWLSSIRGWVPPKPLFDWGDIVDAIEESTIDIAQSRYDKWHNNLPKRPLPPSEDDSELAAGPGVVRRSKRIAVQHSRR